MVWLTPREDRLFLEAASDRRRFFDRLVFAAEPAHGARVSAYERAMRERMRLLTDGPLDADWLTALETQLGEAGAAMASARARSLTALQGQIDSGAERAFPRADLDLTGAFEQLALSGADEAEIAAVVATNVTGTILGTRAAILTLAKQQQEQSAGGGGGHIFSMDGAGSTGGATPNSALPR